MKRKLIYIAVVIMCSCNSVDGGTPLEVRNEAPVATDTLFVSQPVDDAVFKRMEGKSYGRGCEIPLDDLRYVRVLHYNLAGEVMQGELVCHKDIADDLVAIFHELYEARYPIERMTLIDDYDADDDRSMLDNNTSAFNFRFIDGTTRLSNHSLGRAIDINPLYNPYVKASGRVIPAKGKPYADRDADFPYKITRDDVCCQAFLRRGFVWGGDWKSVKDYQHFEKMQ